MLFVNFLSFHLDSFLALDIHLYLSSLHARNDSLLIPSKERTYLLIDILSSRRKISTTKIQKYSKIIQWMEESLALHSKDVAYP